jgi:predicted chitinase
MRFAVVLVVLAAMLVACGGDNGFAVSEKQLGRMFPHRDAFYTYEGLTASLAAYPAFAKTGDETVRKQEVAAFLANVSHETGGLAEVIEQNAANYAHYCDTSKPYGCPAGPAAYYGRGPIQLSWNFNYKAAGDALGLDLLHDPTMVQKDPAIAWKTGLWYWDTQRGQGTTTAHDAMTGAAGSRGGFGATIRSINGDLECDGKNAAQVQSRVAEYRRLAKILDVSPGTNLTC